MKNFVKLLAVIAFAAAAVFAVIGCGDPKDNAGDGDKTINFDIAGSYIFPHPLGGDRAPLPWYFKSDKTFELTNYMDTTRTGKWSVLGNVIKLTVDPIDLGGTIIPALTESYNITASGNQVTLTFIGRYCYALMRLDVAGDDPSKITLTKICTVCGKGFCTCIPFLANTVSAGGVQTLAIKTDGSLWAWGWRDYNKYTPTRIGSETNWATVSADLGNSSEYDYTVAIKKDGSLWKKDYKLLDDYFHPIGTETNWASVSAGRGHRMAIKTDGSLWAWGDNFFGQRGDGTGDNFKTTPVRIGSETNWASVSAGGLYTVAIKTDGSLWAWGNNSYGQLGDGTSDNFKTTPVRIGSETNWATVSAGVAHTVAIKTDGSLWAWGNNYRGQLGDGTGGYDQQKDTPVRIGSETNWASVSAGYEHTVAIKTDGSLWAWGDNYSGQLGNGTISYNLKTTPVRIGSETNWATVSAGMFHTVAIKTDSSLWAWGSGGLLGDGTTDARYVPTQVKIPQ